MRLIHERRFAGDAEDIVPSPDPARLDVIDAIRQLPYRQRQAAILYYWGDFPTAAIAELMGLSEGTVRAHLAQARANLRRVLEVVDV